MLGARSYTQETIDECRAKIDAEIEDKLLEAPGAALAGAKGCR